VADPCDGASTQVWAQGAAGSGSPGSTLVNQGAAGMCLDDPGSVNANNTQLQIATCGTGLAAESWLLPAS
jgi:hypothetical protein